MGGHATGALFPFVHFLTMSFGAMSPLNGKSTWEFSQIFFENSFCVKFLRTQKLLKTSVKYLRELERNEQMQRKLKATVANYNWESLSHHYHVTNKVDQVSLVL